MNNNLDFHHNFNLPERPFNFPNKLLVGAGPVNLSPRVLRALSNNTTGVHCSELFQVMDDIVILLRYLFQTQNKVCLAVQTSGTGGLDAVLCNLLDPGETVLVAVSGFWGQRMVKIAKSRGANVVVMQSAPGKIFTLEELEKEIIKFRPIALFVTHGESSGGTLQNLQGLGEICRRLNCLLVVDAIVSLGAVPFFADRWCIDVVVSSSQKGVGATAGLSLLTMNSSAMSRMQQIKHSPPFYLNLIDTCRQWDLLEENRAYHLTYSSHTLSALREALLEIAEEGLQNRWERHKACANRFWVGLEKLGMKLFVENEDCRLTNVTCCLPPPGICNRDIVKFLWEKYQVVIGFGLSEFAVNTLRIGFMGYNARPEVVDYVLETLENAIRDCRMIK